MSLNCFPLFSVLNLAGWFTHPPSLPPSLPPSPPQYSQQLLLNEINAAHKGKYDFFYLPIDFKNKCNVGYAFINFIDPKAIIPFFKEFNGQR